ncbi:Ig-like domain-containing protein [Anaerosporobacter sp.]|uniref:Ig-like domain-containing protein n=1 Tax=Anaerosporobacter sp. TaxID=1872529 RepID=UPI00286F68E8|nr:Ig-like domain-containing protein [Anaerosporobacter sp.]
MKRKRFIAAFIAVIMVMQLVGNGWLPKQVQAAEVEPIKVTDSNQTIDFESLDGWKTTGNVTIVDGGQSGKCIKLGKDSSIAMTLTGIEQGSYTLSAWVKGTAGNNTSVLKVSDTGAPDAVSLLDTYLDKNAWTQMGHRNILVYNDQITIKIESGQAELQIDTMELKQDSADENTILNWGFENDLEAWKTKNASIDKTQADSGEYAVKMYADGEISQKVAVEPNTKYALTMRAKVDKQDTYKTIEHQGEFGKSGEIVERTSLGNRVNIGVRKTNGTVLRQAPSGTEEYSLVTITFTTGAEDTEVEVYANTIYDENYRDSITVYNNINQTELADEWTGNGSNMAYVDAFDLFVIHDENYLRGADVSMLSTIEDNGGKYFANGVQQDCLRILSNHGVNSIITMLMVHAGEAVCDWNTCADVYKEQLGPNGELVLKHMITGGYFDKEHTLMIAKRATELGMSYVPNFQFSDYWMSTGKGHTPREWIEINYDGTRNNTDLAHMQAIVYNYVYDIMKAMAEADVNVAAVKHGNEQNQGIIWPVGKGQTSDGHVALITASYDAVADAYPGVSGFVHSNNGYTPEGITQMQGVLMQKGAKMDGAAFSLYGGRSAANILRMSNYMLNDASLRYLDYVNVETGFTFTKHMGTANSAKNSAMGIAKYYRASSNGQYNWLLDYIQAALDVPNPYGQTRGFYYWETDWIPTPGADSSYGLYNDIDVRIMFNNGDTAIKEMGSSQSGKSGDMMDSMYAYLMRGLAKNKDESLQTPLRGDSDQYSVQVVEPTSLTYQQDTITLVQGETKRLQPVIAPIDKVLTDNSITYSSSNPSVATVTQTGFVHAKSAGSTTITGVVGKCTASVTVTVTEAVKSQDIAVTVNGNVISNGANIDSKALDKIQLTASVNGSQTVTDQTVQYTSSNPEVAYFFGETWQTPDGIMYQETEKTSTKVQLNVMDAGDTTITISARDGGAEFSFTVMATKTPVDTISLSNTVASISYGRKLQLVATVTPETATLYKVKWTSSDSSIATVDENGIVKGVGLGEATIIATSDDNPNLVATCVVTVTPVKVENIILNKETTALITGTSELLTVCVEPSDANNQNVSWSSADTSIVTVNKVGRITGIATGTTQITATSEDGGFSAVCTVIVQDEAVEVEGIEISEEEYYFASEYFSEKKTLNIPPTYRLKVNVIPENATNSNISWSSDTPTVATVDSYGNVTALSSGMATITATTQNGEFVASTKIYVPIYSEDFENRIANDDTWSMAQGFKPGGNALVVEDGNNNVLSVDCRRSGPVDHRKVLVNTVKSDKVLVSFDWNVGNFVDSAGGYITLADSNNQAYISFQTNTNSEISYTLGGNLVSDNVVFNEGIPIGSGFNKDNTWYHIEVELNMKEGNGTFTVTSLEDSALSTTCNFNFDSSVSYKGDLSRFWFFSQYMKNRISEWHTQIDNFNIYETAVKAKSLQVNASSIKLIPIEGTLGVSSQLLTSVIPASASQEIVWSSSNTSLVTVGKDGLVQAKKIYPSGTDVNDIVTDECIVTATSKEDATIYVQIPVVISNAPNASEVFGIKDSNDNMVYSSGSGGETAALKPGASEQFVPVATGGDGKTDIAKIKWESDNPSLIYVEETTGKVKIDKNAPEGTEATIKLEASLYIGEPLVGTFTIRVEGNSVLLLDALKAAIEEARLAKTKEDSYYTVESFEEYKKVLTSAEKEVKIAEEENWDNSYQNWIDAYIVKVQLAANGLTALDYVELTDLQLSLGNRPILLNRKFTLQTICTPENATEKIAWSSSDEAVIVINSETGEALPLQAGTAEITAVSEQGVVASIQVTVSEYDDLTSWYDETGVEITGTGTLIAEGRGGLTDPFLNARKNILKAESAAVWTTGSQTKAGSIIIDLGDNAILSSMDTLFWATMFYTIDVSDDGENWTKAVDHSTSAVGTISAVNATPYKDIFPDDTVARYVRISVTKASSGWIGICYLRVNGAYVLNPSKVDSVICDSISMTMGEIGLEEKLPVLANVYMTGSVESATSAAIVWKPESVENASRTIEQAQMAGKVVVEGSVMIDEEEYAVTCSVQVVSPHIVQTDIGNAVITLEENVCVYDATAKKPSVTSLALEGLLLEEGTDYLVIYRNNVKVGAAKISIMGISSYTGIITKTFTIKPASIADSVVVLEKDSYDYDGVKKEPKIEVTLADKLLVQDIDYEVFYENNIEVGTANVVITGINGYTGTIGKTFKIKNQEGEQQGGDEQEEGKAISGAVIKLSNDFHVYDGKEKKPDVVVTLGDVILVKDVDYSIAYKDNIEVGTAKIIITGINRYTGTINKTFEIKNKEGDQQGGDEQEEGKAISGAIIKLSNDSYVYDGKEKKPNAVVTLDNVILVKDVDYSIAYKDNIKVGTAKIIVTGIGKYTGSIEKSFIIKKAETSKPETSESTKDTQIEKEEKIEKKSLSNAEMSLSQEEYIYDGKHKEPEVTVKMDGAALTLGKDYFITYGKNVNIGTASVTVTGMGNYEGNIKITFSIIVKKNSTYTVGNFVYQIVKVNADGSGNVTVSSIVKQTATVQIASTVIIGGKKYNITAISKEAFRGDTKIKKLVIGNNVTSIGDYAFQKCTNLTTITIGKKVSKIGKEAFSQCSKLNSITINSTSLTTKNVGDKAFSKIASNAKIKVPSSMKKEYSKWLVEKGVLKKATIK